MTKMAPPLVPVSTAAMSTHTQPLSRTMLPIAEIVPDPGNRHISHDEDFESLCDSIRVSGVLQPLQVWRRADGTHRIVDGERRWRAAQKLELEHVPCEVWPSDADPQRVTVAGLALNEHRKAHGCLHVARRLRDIKNERGFSHAELAGHTGLPLDRVKTYFSIFAGSDDMLKFLEEIEVPLKVAVELVRYERATNEARARRLMARHKESPLTVEEIAALRKREQGAPTAKSSGTEHPVQRRRPLAFIERFEAEVRRDAAALAQLEELVRRLGFRLVPVASQGQM